MEIKEQDLFAVMPEEEETSTSQAIVTANEETPTSSVSQGNPPVEETEPATSTPIIEEKTEEILPSSENEVIAAPSSTEVEPEVAKSAIEVKPKSDNIIWQLFTTFLKIGVVTFGGGYAMIPMIESEVVDKKKWVEKDTFLDLIAIAQACPGVFAINISTFIGYKLRRNLGACMAALGAALPSFIIILLIATMFTQIQDIPWVASCFRGIRPAVVALIAVPTFNLAKSAKISLSNCWIPIISALLIYLLGVNPVFVIIIAALGGYLYGSFLANPQQ